MGRVSDWEDLWREAEPAARHVCSSYFGSNYDAEEDALITVSIAVWAKRDHVVRAGDLKGYVARIAQNVCKRQLAEDRRHTRTAARIAGYTAQTDAPVHTRAALRLQVGEVLGAIASLPHSLRDPLQAHALEGESLEIVAQRTGVSIRTVRRRLRKARERLEQVLQQAAEPSRDREAAQHRRGPGRPKSHRKSEDEQGNRSALEEVDSLLNLIACRLRDTRVIHVPLPTGGVLEYHAIFSTSTARARQRIATLRRYVRRHPQGWRKRVELAELLVATNALAEAEEQYRAILAARPGLTQPALRLGQLLTLGCRTAEAVKVYAAALEHVSDDASRQHLLGLIYRAEGRYQDAEAAFQRAIALDAKNLAHYHELATTYDLQGRVAEACKAWDAALAVDPDDVYALARSHNAMTAMGRYDEVVRRLERAVELDPNYAYAAKLLADRRANMGLVWGTEGRKTRELLQRALLRDPESADVWDAYTRYHDIRGELDISVAIWQAFLQRNPANARGWMFLGSAYDRLHDYERAAEAYLKAASLDPTYPYVYWRGIYALTVTGRRKEALEWIAVMRDRFSSIHDFPHLAAQYLLRLCADPDECLALSRRCVEQHPEVARAWHNYGRLLLDTGHPQEAVVALERALALMPAMTVNRGHTILNLGRALRECGREAEATAAFAEVEQFGRKAKAWYVFYMWFIGVARMEMGDLEKAEYWLRKALERHCWFVHGEYEEVQRRLEATRGKASP